jgi:hypothetical protein
MVTMMMLAAAIALNVTIDLGPKRTGRSSRAPVVTCHKGAVSYKFVGTPGTKFVYGGDEYALPMEGSIELLPARGAAEFVLAGEKLPVDVGPLDAFGTRIVDVPMPQSTQSTPSTQSMQSKGEQYAEAHR